MIPWVREKIAEKRAKWLAARNSPSENKKPNSRHADTRKEDANTTGHQHSYPINTGRRSSALSLFPPSRSIRHNVEYLLANYGAREVETSLQPSCGNTTQKNARISRCSSTTQSEPSDEKLVDPAQAHEQQTTLDGIVIRIICPNSRLLKLQIENTKRLVELKNEILLELADDPAALPLFATDVRQLATRYRVFRADFDGTELNEMSSLKELHIAHNDTLVLVQRRNVINQIASAMREVQPPRLMEIEMATNNLSFDTQNLPLVDINEIFQQSNLQFDVRKVLISLAQVSAKVIAAGPYATRLIEMLKQKLINKRDYQVETVQCLIDMGFRREDAEYAFKLHNNIYSQTLEWLVANQNREEEENAGERFNNLAAALAVQKSQSLLSPSVIMTNNSIIENAEALLEIVRIYSHRDIPPTADSVAGLVDMGFQEADVIKALKKTCNNRASACEWLCGNRSGSLVELREGLSPDSPILKTILEIPQVQLNLGNPKVLLAFLTILENEQSIRVWGGDNDTTSVITNVLQKYHEEKHVMGLNQFYSDR